MKTPRGASESSTTSDNTTEFIDIVKKYDVVYNTHNPDYKNVEVKMKVWLQIAEEIGLSVDASKRKWKNLRDSYTKYLRSFRIGTKSKKYQYWAHAEHMDFLKPYQGPGRNSANTTKTNEDDDTECDLGYQVLAKASSTSNDEELKNTTASNPASSSSQAAVLTIPPPAVNSPATTAFTTLASSCSTSTLVPSSTVTTSSASLMLPVPSLPTVHLPPQLTGKPVLASMPTLPSTSVANAQIFTLPQISNTLKMGGIPMPTASSVGCLILEPQLFASCDTFKKELSTPAAAPGLFHNITSQASTVTPTTSSRINPSLITKIRRVQPSPQTAAINLSFSAAAASSATQPSPAKNRKINDIDVSAVLQANRDLDANTLFFLSLARTVRSMPTKYQSLAKMRCMRIVSDIELELDNASDFTGPNQDDGCGGNGKFCSMDSPPPPPEGATGILQTAVNVNDAGTEHFVYVMSPSRVESMIDISSDEEATMNGN